MKTLPFFLFSISLVSGITLSRFSFAGTVTKNTDNQKIILDFDGETAPVPEDQIYVLDQNSHKEIGLVKIVKVKGSRALGKLLKGNAKPGDTTDIARTKRKNKEEREPAEESNLVGSSNRDGNEKNHISRISYGVGADFVYTSMYMKNDVGEGAITGNGFGIRGALDYPINRDWLILGSLGLHPLNASSTTSGYPMNLSINYLALEGVLRYVLDKRNEGLWIGGGLGYYLPMSSNLEGSKPKSQLTLLGSAGYNMRLSRDYFTLKSDFVMFQSEKESGSTTQTFQLVLGGVYFF